MVSFRNKLSTALINRGMDVCYGLADTPYDVILVIGGTRNITGLWRARRRGIPVVQRLDGMNWIHRKRRTGWQHFLRSEYGNLILSLIRSRFASRIVYQSEFSRQWWEHAYGPTPVSCQVVYNGVDLSQYSSVGLGHPPTGHYRLLMVEGSFGGGYEMGLETAIHLAEKLNNAYGRDIELMMVGRVTSGLQDKWKQKTNIPLNFSGIVPPESIPEIDRSAHLLFASDLNAACPNSTIEALACGLPVVAYDTGALVELVTGDAGRVVPYGGDPWELEPPDIDGLARAADEILANQNRFRVAARNRAEQAFSLDKMVDGYLEALKA